MASPAEGMPDFNAVLDEAQRRFLGAIAAQTKLSLLTMATIDSATAESLGSTNLPLAVDSRHHQ